MTATMATLTAITTSMVVPPIPPRTSRPPADRVVAVVLPHVAGDHLDHLDEAREPRVQHIGADRAVMPRPHIGPLEAERVGGTGNHVLHEPGVHDVVRR